MDLVNMTEQERFMWMRKRHTHFTAIVKGYTSFENLIRDWEEKMALWGVEMTNCGEYIRLHIQLDITEYEDYHVVMGAYGHLTISPAVWWEENYANTLSDIFTGHHLEAEDITRQGYIEEEFIGSITIKNTF